MARKALTREERQGAEAAAVVVLLVLLLFVLLLLAGPPIVGLKSEALSLFYAVAVYTPVIVLALVTYRRLR